MITPAESFAADELKRETLLGVLRSRELHEALGILKDELEPDATDTAALGNPQIAISQRHLIAGANHIIKGLDRLTKAVKKPGKIVANKPLLSEEEFKKKKVPQVKP